MGRITQKELFALREDWLARNYEYQFCHHTEFNYGILNNIMYITRSGRTKKKTTYNNCIIMCDTETSKKRLKDAPQKTKLDSGYTARECHVVAWTISIRAFNMNICTIWGHRPSTFCETIHKIHDQMLGDVTIMYFHNLSYDHWFLRRFLYKELGNPVKSLNIKAHYPLFMRFECGIEIRDSLILAQVKLEKWAKDLHVEHQKSVGKWNYNKFRSQSEVYNADELEYIEHDTLAGVECIDKLMQNLGKRVYSMPFTSTGIIRKDLQEIGKENGAHEFFLSIAPDYDQYQKFMKAFHGGYVHANRHFIDTLITLEEFGQIDAWDFMSSYPFCMLAFKYPMEKFHKTEDRTADQILRSSDTTAFIFKFVARDIKLRSPNKTSAPALQFSKCVEGSVINPVIDNGRILEASYLEIYLTEIDLQVIHDQYKAAAHICTEVEYATKAYLPRWFTDYVYKQFYGKCELSFRKKEDPVNYMVKKTKVNGCYGLTVQKSIQDLIIECFEADDQHESGEYFIQKYKTEAERIAAEHKQYNKYLKNKNSILPYFWGVWVTSYAFRNIHILNECIMPADEGGLLLYNDTDSAYGVNWDTEKIENYNMMCKTLLLRNGYSPVVINGKEFILGSAEHKPLEDEYTEFKVEGAKRYAGRCREDGKIHITVAGVPKEEGALCLHDDLNEFTKGCVFDGKTTGKLQHNYFSSEIYIDKEGNETADSIDLTPANYKLDPTDKFEWSLFDDDIELEGIYDYFDA